MSRSPVKPEILPQRQLHGQSVSILEALVAMELIWNIFYCWKQWSYNEFMKKKIVSIYVFCFGVISCLRPIYEVSESNWTRTSFIVICYCCLTFSYNHGMENQFPDDCVTLEPEKVIWDPMFFSHNNNFPLKNNFLLSINLTHFSGFCKYLCSYFYPEMGISTNILCIRDSWQCLWPLLVIISLNSVKQM